MKEAEPITDLAFWLKYLGAAVSLGSVLVAASPLALGIMVAIRGGEASFAWLGLYGSLALFGAGFAGIVGGGVLYVLVSILEELKTKA